MREILFRGKQEDNGEWVYGAYYHQTEFYGDDCDYHYIISSCDELEDNMMCFDGVIPETVGQYTGLTDKNGQKIFEGDIVAQNWYDHNEPADDSFGEVVFCEYDCSFSVIDVEKDGIVPLGKCHAYHWEAEVIGNIHDNPELIESEDNK